MATLGLNRLTSTAKAGLISGVMLLGAAAYYILFYDDLAQSIDRARTREKSLHADFGDRPAERVCLSAGSCRIDGTPAAAKSVGQSLAQQHGVPSLLELPAKCFQHVGYYTQRLGPAT